MNRRTLLAAGFSLAAGPVLAQVQALPRADRELVDQAVAYMQGLTMAKGRFTQTNARGAASEGTLYLNRPGKARFEYDPPAQMLLVADGRNVSIYDRRLKTFDRYPLGATPLGIFLSRRVRLDEDVRVVRVTRSADGFSITMTAARGRGDGQLILEFDADPVALRGWTVIDAQGLSTRIALAGLAPVDGLDAGLFVLTDPRRATPG